jgi:phospholipase D-like protein
VPLSYNFLDFFWDTLLVFAWVVWFWLLITVFSDLFRRRDISGWKKAAWVVFVLVLPYGGVLVYLVAEHHGIAERNAQTAQAQQRQLDEYVQSVAGPADPTTQIAQAKTLLDDGAITGDEFERIKQKALA